MAAWGVVARWYSDEGWGVIDSAATPGGCFAHFSAVVGSGYRELAPGTRVELDWERAEQDGFHFRATRVVPAGADPSAVDGAQVALPGA